MNIMEILTEEKEGWFYSEKFNHAQKVNNKVYCYVTYLIFGYVVQLYMRGDVCMCELEARVDGRSLDGLDEMFKIGDEWLEKYGNSDLEEIRKDKYSVHNVDGVWRDGSKNYWISLNKGGA